MSRWKLVIAALILVFGGTGLGVGLWLRNALRPVEAGQTRIFHVPAGASGSRIARDLWRSGLIRNPRAFELGLRWWGLGSELKPGYYEISAGMAPEGIARKIAAGETAKWRLTIPEGFILQQIAERAAQHPGVDREKFLEAAEGAELGSEVGLELPPASGAEGFLFPETYLLEYGAPAHDVILAMLREFQRRIEPLQDEIAASALSLAEIVTLASLIEREAMVAEERPVISAVYHNRMARGMKLECDATVVYIWARRGVVKRRLLYEDLEVESPYNTYKHKGLPPGPIANPGIDCIRAALRPADVDYLYYVARGDGSHIFSETFKGHRAAIARIRGR